MRELRLHAAIHFGEDVSEQRLCGDNSLAVDFYFKAEATIVEIALGVQKPNSEFEKDVLKAVMAKERGHAVERLVLIARAGGRRKCDQPGRRAIVEWARTRHGVQVDVLDLPGEPNFESEKRARVRRCQPRNELRTLIWRKIEPTPR